MVVNTQFKTVYPEVPRLLCSLPRHSSKQAYGEKSWSFGKIYIAGLGKCDVMTTGMFSRS